MYKEVYYKLFNSITDVIRMIENGNNMDKEKLLERVEAELKHAQCAAEEVIISRQDAI